jgi:hypothetical protein
MRSSVNYPSMTKQQAQVTWRQRRDNEFILRYSQQGHALSDDLRELFAALDGIDDETLEEYLRQRRLKHTKATEVPVDPWIDIKRTKINTTPEPGPYGNIGDNEAKRTVPAGTVGKYSRHQQPAKAHSDRALEIAKRKAVLGQRVDYGQILEAVERGAM